ncbi:hypothetical protein N7486_001014 [Penicillium sp. IBT 16267x]|nr:hypothetical protein N7486_001014 [Penicillium sp. IBT 16267x]
MDIEDGMHGVDMLRLARLGSTNATGDVDLEVLLASLLLSPEQLLQDGMLLLAQGARERTVWHMIRTEKRRVMQDGQKEWQKRYRDLLRRRILDIINATLERQARYLHSVPLLCLV